MNKRLLIPLRILLIGLACLTVLIAASYRKALRIETEVLLPSLTSTMSYQRTIRFGMLNPFVSILPHWTIHYFEEPTDIGYQSPSITVNCFGQISGSSKEVAGLLVEKGYRDSY